jgi:hypothetical protein
VAFVRADQFQFGFLLLSLTSVFQLGFGSERTFFKFPKIAKPFSLGVILERPFINRNIWTKCQCLAKLKDHLTYKVKNLNQEIFYLLCTFCLFNLYSFPHSANVCITGDNVSPKSVKVYSTFGGISA